MLVISFPWDLDRTRGPRIRALAWWAWRWNRYPLLSASACFRASARPAEGSVRHVTVETGTSRTSVTAPEAKPRSCSANTPGSRAKRAPTTRRCDPRQNHGRRRARPLASGFSSRNVPCTEISDALVPWIRDF